MSSTSKRATSNAIRVANADEMGMDPSSALVRDACTCGKLPLGRRKHATQKERLCAACAAWEHERVLVDGKQRYLRSQWLFINFASLDATARSRA